MTGPRRFWLVAALALTLLGRTGLPSHAQPADESPAATDARLAAAAVTRVGPSYLYPDHATTPGVVNPDVTQANIQQTICVRGWTATVRPPASYTNHLKQQQLAAAQATDRSPAHYEEDHFISLELGGHPHDARNLWRPSAGARPRIRSRSEVRSRCILSEPRPTTRPGGGP